MLMVRLELTHDTFESVSHEDSNGENRTYI